MVIGMRHNVSSAILLCVCVTALSVAALPMRVCAEDDGMPHLIQTVTEKDIYEGMLALGLMESPHLAAGDCEEAYENVKSCVVGINMGNAHGSGVIWDMTLEQTIIVTNKHVLEYWDDLISYVQFPQGYFMDAKVLGVSETHDVGFLVIDNNQLAYEELEKLRYVCKDADAYQDMEAGDEIFCLGAGVVHTGKQEDALYGSSHRQESGIGTVAKSGADADENFYKGSIGEMQRYIDEFGEYMIYGLGYARPGMSGGGTFDAKGNFIGMISGGTVDGETASVPLPVIAREYEEILQIS